MIIVQAKASLVMPTGTVVVSSVRTRASPIPMIAYRMTRTQ